MPRKNATNYEDARDPYQTLALAVIHRAFEDLRNKCDSGTLYITRKERRTAHEFLSGMSRTLPFWCGIAKVNPQKVIRKYWSEHSGLHQ